MCGDLVRFGDLPGFSIDMVPLLLQLRNCTVCFFLFALLLPTTGPRYNAVDDFACTKRFLYSRSIPFRTLGMRSRL